MKRNIYRKNNGGYAIVTALIFFLVASMAVIAGLSDSVFREVRTVKNESLSKQAYFVSESALEDAAYRIKRGKIIGASGTLGVDSSTALFILGFGDEGTKEVVSTGNSGGMIRKTKAVLKTGEGVSFAFAIETGLGGIDLSGGAGITGDVYTTGSIRGCSGCAVSGEAVAAGRSVSSLQTDNGSPIPPGQYLVFGNTNGTQDIAQSFSVSDTISILRAGLYMKKTGNPANAVIKIVPDIGGEPSAVVLAEGTLFSSLISTEYEWQDVTLTSNPVLSLATVYWLVVDGSHSQNNYFSIGLNSSYADGGALTGRQGGNWDEIPPSGSDVYFRVYSGTNETGISGQSGFTLGGAYAYEVNDSTVSGSLYCQTGAGNNKPCDTSRADPEVREYPVPDDKINIWKAQAETSVHQGDYFVNGVGATLGPKKIEGDLYVTGGGTLSVSGTIWVTGSVTLDGNSYIQPADSSKSFVIIADGTAGLAGGGEIRGSQDSHILLISLSSADPAIVINGGASDTVIFAPDGGINIVGGALVRAGSARHLNVSGSANITYDPDLADLNFSSGMPNLDFHIDSWKEVE